MKWQGRRQSEKISEPANITPQQEENYRNLYEGEEFIRNFNDRHGMTNPMAKKAGYNAMTPLGNKAKAKLRTRDPHRSPEYWSEYRREWDAGKEPMGEPTRVDHDNKSYKYAAGGYVSPDPNVDRSLKNYDQAKLLKKAIKEQKSGK